MTTLRPSNRLLCSAAAVLFNLVGCADVAPESDDVGAHVDHAADTLAQQIQPAANPPLFVKVSAAGAGCPKGTWETIIGEGGRTFTVFFEKYLLNMEENSSQLTSNCTIIADVTTPNGFEWAVQTVSFDGTAVLEPGMKGTLEAKFAYTGDSNAQSSQFVIDGPYDELYHFSEDLLLQQKPLNWSLCGRQRQLQIRTFMTLKNASPRKTGLLSLTHLDADTAKFEVGFAKRPCR